MRDSPPGQWRSPIVTGQPPPPCSRFTLTPVGDKKAAMFGGRKGTLYFNELLIVELRRNSMVSVFYTQSLLARNNIHRFSSALIISLQSYYMWFGSSGALHEVNFGFKVIRYYSTGCSAMPGTHNILFNTIYYEIIMRKYAMPLLYCVLYM